MPSNMKWMITFAVLLIPIFAYASFDVDPVFEEKIDASILDVAVKSDGDMVFVLTPGAVLIYSVEKKTVLDRIPVDKHFTGVAYQETGRLVLTSTNPSMISILQVSRVFDINIKNRAVKGPSGAGATIVIFDDYQ